MLYYQLKVSLKWFIYKSEEKSTSLAFAFFVVLYRLNISFITFFYSWKKLSRLESYSSLLSPVCFFPDIFLMERLSLNHAPWADAPISSVSLFVSMDLLCILLYLLSVFWVCFLKNNHFILFSFSWNSPFVELQKSLLDHVISWK